MLLAVWLFIFILSLEGQECTLCYSCDNISTSEDCFNVSDCSGRQQDSVEGGKWFCSELCQDNLCNLDKCMLPVSPRGKTNRPPRCFACDLITDPLQCKNLVQCAEDEVCFIRQIPIYGKQLYRMGCMEKQHCNESKQGMNSPQLIGKRELTSGDCATCCTSDHCNWHVCSPNHAVPSENIHPLQLLGDNDTCYDFNEFSCQTFGALDVNACKLMPDIDVKCPRTCGFCGHYGWSNWNEWSFCSKTCDDGTTTRTRTCLHQLNATNTNICIGSSAENRTCNSQKCAVNGQWSNWEDWQNCSVTCGNGTKVRYRSCNNPIPQSGGLNCTGNDMEIDICEETPCPVDGRWCVEAVGSRCYCNSQSYHNYYDDNWYRQYTACDNVQTDVTSYTRSTCDCPSPKFGGLDGGWCFKTQYLCQHTYLSYVGYYYAPQGSETIKTDCNCPAPLYGGTCK